MRARVFFLSMSTYLVTGGAGFIGSHITTALAARGDRVRVVDDLSTGTAANLAHLDCTAPGGGGVVELWEGDCSDAGLLKEALAGVTCVFHEAAQVSVPESFEDPERSYRINVTGTLRLMEGCRRQGVERVVLASSSAIYGDSPELPKREDMASNPLSPYASGKLAAEEILRVWGREYGIRTVALRYFNVFGPRQADDSPYSGVIAIFSKRLLSSSPVTIHGDGLQTRDFVYVDDIVEANLLASEVDVEPGAFFNVGTGSSITLLDLYGELAKLAGSSAEPVFGAARTGDVRASRADITRATRVLKYSPRTDWRDGLATTFGWYATRRA